MSRRPITDEFVAEVARDLRDRYELDDAGLAELATGLADSTSSDAPPARDFATGFIGRHQATFDRLA